MGKSSNTVSANYASRLTPRRASWWTVVSVERRRDFLATYHPHNKTIPCEAEAAYRQHGGNARLSGKAVRSAGAHIPPILRPACEVVGWFHSASATHFHLRCLASSGLVILPSRGERSASTSSQADAMESVIYKFLELHGKDDFRQCSAVQA